MEKEENKPYTIEDEINNFIKQNSSIMYKQVSKEIGSRYSEGGKEHKNTIDGKFTKVYFLFSI